MDSRNLAYSTVATDPWQDVAELSRIERDDHTLASLGYDSLDQLERQGVGIDPWKEVLK